MHRADQRMGRAGPGDERAGLEDDLLALDLRGESHEGEVGEEGGEAVRVAGALGKGLGGRRWAQLGPAVPDAQGDALGLVAGAEGLDDRVEEGEVGVDDDHRVGGDRCVEQRGTAPPARGARRRRHEARLHEGIEVLADRVVVEGEAVGQLGGGQGDGGGLDEFEDPAARHGEVRPGGQVRPGGSGQELRRGIRSG
ncbi:hypothetical protein ADENT20671_0171 [Actinomyces denticolens]|nr:hypothetical protein ADENT20671_0171 [Actinomyces denticolens]